MSTVRLCVLVWAVPGAVADLGHYEDQVLGLLPYYGGVLVSRDFVEDAGDDAPAEVHILEFPDQDALDSYLIDPNRAALEPLRRSSVERTQVLRLRWPEWPRPRGEA